MPFLLQDSEPGYNRNWNGSGRGAHVKESRFLSCQMFDIHTRLDSSLGELANSLSLCENIVDRMLK